MGHDRYDVIIVGAGPGGSSAAKLCAENDLSVALIERGEYPGSKNMFGGSLYRAATEQIVPSFWEEAPIERNVVREVLYFMEPSSVVEMGYTSYNFNKPPYNTFTVIRSRFDRWFAGVAEKAGAHLMNSTLVEDLVYEKDGLISKKVAGVILEDGTKLYSDIVILAEGGMADLTKKAGMRKEIKSNMLSVYVKELISLPKEVIEARFNLEKDEGMNIGMLGYPASNTLGKGGIWVNKDTISLVVGVYLNQLIKHGLNPYQLISKLKEHPRIKRLVDGGEIIQYMSKIIPKGGYNNIPELYDDGIMIVGDAGMLVSGRHGTDVAMMSGKFAAETAIQAKAKGDFSKKILSAYHLKLDPAFFVENLKIKSKSKYFYKNHPDSDFLISQVLNEVGHEFFSEENLNQYEKYEMMIEEIRKLQPLSKTIKDFYHSLLSWRIY